MARLSAYGLTDEDYEAMLEAQEYRCAICYEHEVRNVRFAVDHCHKSGKTRFLLCAACNTGLGLFKEDPEILTRAAEYIHLTRRFSIPDATMKSEE